MKKFQITLRKGLFKDFNSQFQANEVSKRVTYTLTVVPPDYETTIFFVSENGEEISIEDFQTISRMFS